MDLRDFQDRRSRREALEQELEQLFQRQSELSLRVKQEKINLDYERSDVEALEGGTFNLNVRGIINETEKKLERSRQHQADLWARLSELLKKYEA